MTTIELIKEGLKILFSLEPFLMLFFGIVIGLVFGSLPGFTSSNTAALMLPLTLGMSTGGAIVFIAALYCAAQYSGGIPSILLGVPGTAGAICTVFDGYPMAKAGQADRALGLSLASSSLGGFVSAILAIFIIRPLASIALAFGPAEMTLLAVLGLSIIASVVGKDLKKGLLCALVGLLISTMSADPVLALPRLSFGFFELYEEVPFIPLIIGIFAFPSVLDMFGKERIANEAMTIRSRTIDGVIEATRKPYSIIRSSLIGLIVGIIPGTGITSGSFMSYATAKNLSKSPETFGKGNPEGIIAAEAANNGVTAGAMVPTLALGIPGAGTPAIMLAILILHGVTIGPQVIRTHPGETYAVMLTCILVSILIFPLGWLYNKLAVKVTTIKVSYIIPGIFVLCVAGSFAFREFVFDTYLVFIAGLIGIILEKGDYPLAPFILGIILGVIAEANFTRAIMISRGDLRIFFSSPISIIMWIVVFVSLSLPIIIKVIHKLQETRSVK